MKCYKICWLRGLSAGIVKLSAVQDSINFPSKLILGFQLGQDPRGKSGLAAMNAIQNALQPYRRSSLIQFRTVVAESAKLQEEVPLNSNHDVPADTEGDDVDPSPSAITQCTWTFNQYWSYIDILLDELREDARTNTSTTQAAEEFVKKFFTEVLQADLRKYPSTTSLAPSLDSVTVDWQKTIHSKLIW
ncbi:hypothetical protein F4604DRAFT_1683808 [Suillus subluteus]|nr:hypothetical protein F4604DRAFT_1683808 [Suillus subluteus]